MTTADETLPKELITLWPKLGSSYRLLRRWDRKGGIIFVGEGDQGLSAARIVAGALSGKTIEVPVDGIPKTEYEKVLGKYLDQSVTDVKAAAAGMDRLCVIIPRIDRQASWLRQVIKGYCENGRRPFVLLLTCPDLEWMPTELNGHLTECRKKGAPRRTTGQRQLEKLKRPKDGAQRSLLK